MKINHIKINAFGKVKNKEINLDDNLNIIYGKNEAGKSTILKFIINSFYGISKNKKGKEYSDYERYKPWDTEEFSGKIKYELDNKKKFELMRDFNKKNPQIFDENMEDISKSFNIDKTKGNEFFYEQTKVDEALFLSSLIVNQQEVKIEKNEQNILIQKIANIVGTGEDNVSYKNAIDRINRRQLDEIGTERSREKPINILKKNIKELNKEKEELEKYNYLKYEIEEKTNSLEREIEKLEKENELIRDVKLLLENRKIDSEKIKIKENIKNENNNKLNELEVKKEEIIKLTEKEKDERNKEIKKQERKQGKTNKKLIILFIAIVLINILQFLVIKNTVIKYTILITIPIFLIYMYILKNKAKINYKNLKKIEEEKNKEIELEINNLDNEINLIKRNNKTLENELNDLKKIYNQKIYSDKEKIEKKYIDSIEENKIDYFLEVNDITNINYEIEDIQKEINEKKLQMHSLKIDKENIEPKLDNLSKIEEELVNDNNKMSTLTNINSSMELAKELIKKAYEKMKKTVTPKFTEKLSNNIKEITNNKYNNVMMNDSEGILVETEKGNYVPANKLSVGTIDQLYLSLRLSMVDTLSEEKMPIILDEAFAYYDNDRLKNILKYLFEKYNDRQIIIFTCTNREKDILNNLNLKYNLIEI